MHAYSGSKESFTYVFCLFVNPFLYSGLLLDFN